MWARAWPFSRYYFCRRRSRERLHPLHPARSSNIGLKISAPRVRKNKGRCVWWRPAGPKIKFSAHIGPCIITFLKPLHQHNSSSSILSRDDISGQSLRAAKAKRPPARSLATVFLASRAINLGAEDPFAITRAHSSFSDTSPPRDITSARWRQREKSSKRCIGAHLLVIWASMRSLRSIRNSAGSKKFRSHFTASSAGFSYQRPRIMIFKIAKLGVIAWVIMFISGNNFK